MSFQPQARYAALSGYGALSDSLGLDWPRLMRSVGLDPAGLAVQDRWIPAAAVARLLEISAAASGREDFGLRLTSAWSCAAGTRTSWPPTRLPSPSSAARP